MLGGPVAGQRQQHLKSGRNSLGREVAGQCPQQPVAAAPVGQAHAPDVPVVVAGVEQVGEGELVQHADGTPAARRDELPHRAHQRPGQHQPPQAQARGEGFARRPGVDHVLGRQRLHRADRIPVEAELAVVVVLEHQRPRRGGGAGERGAPVGGECHAGRVLVRGRHHDGGCVHIGDPRARVVDVHARDGQPRRGGEVAEDPQRRVLEGDLADPFLPEDRGQHRQRVLVARAHDDPLRFGDDAAAAREVVRQACPEFVQTRLGGVVQRRGRNPAQHPARGGEPGLPGEEGEVRSPGAQTPPCRGLGRTRTPGCGAGRGDLVGRDRRRRALPGADVAFHGQIGVDPGHRAPREAEVGRERPGGGQGRAVRQAPGPDRAPQGLGQAPPSRGRFPVQMEVATGTGPRIRHGTGPYPCASRR